MLAEDELSKDLLKKTNYSKNKTIESEAEMSTSSDELVLAGKKCSQSRREHRPTFYLDVFFAKATNEKYTKHLPAIA